MSGKFVVNFDTESRLITLGPFKNSLLLEVSEKLFERGYSLVDSRKLERRKHSSVYVTEYCSKEEITWSTFEELNPELLLCIKSCYELDDIIAEAWQYKYEVYVSVYSPTVLKKKFLIFGNEFIPKLMCLFNTGCSVSNRITFNRNIILDKSLPSNRKIEVFVRPCLKSSLEETDYENVVRYILESSFFREVEFKKYALSVIYVQYSKRVYIGQFASVAEAQKQRELLLSSRCPYSLEIEEVETRCDFLTVDSYLASL